jgi:hypothetical protein
MITELRRTFELATPFILEKNRDHSCDKPAQHREHKEQPKLVTLAARSSRSDPGCRNREGNQDEKQVASKAEGIHVGGIHG